METDLESYLSKDADTEGFDLQNGKSWIYPTNYPMREYQYRIVQEALYQNTLVSLPTGLGKTFIAAVVMYNFYRWYPTGKVIFMAPTRPLVKQQIDACYDIMAIPQNITAELTGTKVQTSREEIWKTKRVFFVTPQVLQNDITTFPDLAKQIKCLVFDEAHKARGNHAYCEVIRKLITHSKYFRVLALSATPGNSSNDIIDVSMNLLISHLEVRTEDSLDVAPYVFQRALETVVVPLGGKLEEMRAKYLRVLEKYVKVLKDHKIITGNCANLTKGKIFMTLKDFNHRQQQHRHPNHADIVRTLNVCITLYHGYELLIRHGMRGFLNFFEEHSEKALLRGNSDLFAIMEEIQQYIGPRPDINLLPDGTIPQIADNTKFGHPKFYKLRNIVLEYFSDVDNKSSKVIIFSEFKETVMEAYAMLMQHIPMVQPKYFMGQGAITQKQQMNIIKSFKDGECNTLISTCIGEEGLDIGEVDLIICFDISNKSPIRLVQRMGRTGRKKQGKVIVLVTEGKEQELLKDSLANKNYLSTHILKSREITKNLYKDDPRMIPKDVFPSCQKMHISVPKIPVKGKSGNIKDMFKNLARSGPSISQVLSGVEIIVSEERIVTPVPLWNQSEPLSKPFEDVVKFCDYARYLDALRNHQSTEKIGHSRDTDILVSLLQFSDSKRYNLPITQAPGLVQFSNKRRKRSESSDNFKQTDIRHMFSKPKTTSLDTVNEALSQTSTSEDSEKKKIDYLINDLLSEISSYMIICYTETKVCKFCEKTSLCNRLQKPNGTNVNIANWTQPDITMLEQLTEKDFDKFLHDLTAKESSQFLNEKDLEALQDMMDMDEKSFHFDETPKKQNTFSFEVPKSVMKVIGADYELSLNIDEFDQTFKNEICGKNNSQQEISTHKSEDGLCKFDSHNKTNSTINRSDDTSQIMTNIKSKDYSYENVLINYKISLQFFELNHVEDLFDDSAEDRIEKCNKSYGTFHEAPVISNRNSDLENQSGDSSPIICSYSQKPKNNSVAGRLEEDAINSTVLKSIVIEEHLECRGYSEKTPKIINKSNLKSKLQSVSKSDFYIAKYGNKQRQTKNANTGSKAIDSTKKVLSIDDICDLSIFDLSKNDIKIETKIVQDTVNGRKIYNTNNNNDVSEDLFVCDLHKSERTNLCLSIADVCDISSFGLTEKLFGTSPTATITSENVKKNAEVADHKKSEPYDIDLTINESPIKENTEYSTTTASKQPNLNMNIADICDVSFFGLTQELCANKSSSETTEINNDKVKGSVIDKSTANSKSSNLLLERQITINLTADELPGRRNNIIKDDSLSDSDGSQSPILGYTKPSVTQKYSWKKSQFSNNEITNKSSQLLLEDLCDTSIFGLDMTLPDNTDKERLSPILSQKFKKPNLLKMKLLTQDKYKTHDASQNKSVSSNKTLNNFDICDLSAFGFDIQETLAPKTQDTSDVTITQVIDLINKPTNEQHTDKAKKAKTDTSFLHLLDDENVFEDSSPHKTPVKVSAVKQLQNSAKKTPRRCNEKYTARKVCFSDSDDEFEKLPQAQIYCKRGLPLSAAHSAMQSRRSDDTTATERNQKKRKKRAKNIFIDDEAVLSSDEYATDDTNSEGGNSQDVLEMSFINDASVANTTAIHAKYLQSVRSPLRHNGGFKIPKRPARNILNVFSQKENYEDNTYLEDSFCVDVEDDQISYNSELSELEIAERRLEEYRKQKRKSSHVVNYKKRRRVLVVSSDSE